MPDRRYCPERDLQAYTPSVAPPADANYPVTHLRYITENPILEAWRSTSTAQQIIDCDLGSVVAIESVVLWDTNFTSIEIDGQAYTLTQDPDTERYNLWVLKAINKQIVQIVVPASQTTTDGLTVYRMGLVQFIPQGKLRALAYINTGATRQVTDPTFSAGRSRADAVPGDKRVTEAWPLDYDYGADDQMLELSRIPLREHIVTFDTERPTSELLLARPEDEPTRRLDSTRQEGTFSVVEVV